MKSIIEKTIYAGLGLLGDGTGALKNLGQEIRKKADVSEAEGHKLARKLQIESSKAVKSIRKNLNVQVTQFANAIHAAISESAETKKPKHASKHIVSLKKISKPKTRRTGGRAVGVK